jgi:bifunctional non-homologous end joining protein LigD
MRPEGEVKFTEWTSEDEMRHPAFLGLRTDKKALDVIRDCYRGQLQRKHGP